MANQQKRQTAHKTSIKNLLDGKFVKGEGWDPSYVIDGYGRKISRVSLICTVVDIPQEENYPANNSIVIDDGTAKITARAFEGQDTLKLLNLGDTISLFGRVREYSSERYVIPEIINKVTDSKWIAVHKKELSLLEKNKKTSDSHTDSKPVRQGSQEVGKEADQAPGASLKQQANQDTVVTEEISDDEVPGTETEHLSTAEVVLATIRQLDSGGSGADIDEVISKSKVQSCEDIIRALLLEGDIFEIKPGKLKVLD